MSQQICAAMLGEVEEDDEPEMVEHQGNFSRTVYSTEFCSVTFEAPEGTDEEELERLAWAAYNAERYNDWHNGNDYDCGETELDDVEEV